MPAANKFLFIIFKILIVFTLCFPAVSYAEGLMFSSNDSLVAKRTSYDVFKNTTPVFKEHLLIDFELLLWDQNHLGYIFNVSNKSNSYSLSYINTNNTSYLNFNIDRISNKLKIPLQDTQLKKHKWIKVKIDFNLASNSAMIFVDGKSYQATDLDFGGELPAKLMFGKNQYYTEVPNMAIRNLAVGDNSSKYFFPLNEWKGSQVHDNEGDVIGFVENPIWLINDSYFWKPIHKNIFNQVAGFNYDITRQKLIIYKSDSLLTYDPQTGTASSAAYKNQLPVKMVLGKSLFNTKENKCYIYEVYHDSPYNGASIAALDLTTMLWQNLGKATFPEQRHHHNSFYNGSQDSIFLFGGYGGYKYYNTFFKYDQTKDQWQPITFKGDRISPRFFSASGPTENKDEVFLFGGYGNQSGNQIIGGKQFYDLYRVNLKTHTVKKCWNIQPHDKEVFVPANNLILSADKQYFYALCYPHELAKTNLRLYKFSIKDGSYEVVSAPIPVTSEKIETDINLFYNNKADEFYCTIQEFTNPLNSTIKVYALSAPPVSMAAYLAATAPKKNFTSLILYVGIGCIALLAVLMVLFLWKRRRLTTAVTVANEAESITYPEPEALVKKNAVYLLGEFAVFDKAGRDITYLFSPKIKQLFLLILLNSKNGKGISSKKISSTLWPDKDVSKTKNIKGVTFNHLRSSIADMDGIQLLFVNDTYVFETTATFFCDYFKVDDGLSNTTNTDALIAKNYDLISRGTLLPDMADQWVDDFKRTYDEQIINRFIPQLSKPYKEKNFKLVLEIATLILNIDPFNDSAFRYKLKCYKTTKGIEYAKRIYDNFATDYNKSLGEPYPINFEKALQ